MLSLKAINLQGRLRILIGRQLYKKMEPFVDENESFRCVEKCGAPAKSLSTLWKRRSQFLREQNFRKRRLQENSRLSSLFNLKELWASLNFWHYLLQLINNANYSSRSRKIFFMKYNIYNILYNNNLKRCRIIYKHHNPDFAKIEQRLYKHSARESRRYFLSRNVSLNWRFWCNNILSRARQKVLVWNSWFILTDSITSPAIKRFSFLSRAARNKWWKEKGTKQRILTRFNNLRPFSV